MKRKYLLTSMLLILLLITTPAAAVPNFSASGANPAAIQATVDNSRAALGALNSNLPGSFGSGVRITSYNSALGGLESLGADLAVMDDSIYAEPVPLPGTFLLLRTGLAGLWLRRRFLKRINRQLPDKKKPLQSPSRL